MTVNYFQTLFAGVGSCRVAPPLFDFCLVGDWIGRNSEILFPVVNYESKNSIQNFLFFYSFANSKLFSKITFLPFIAFFACFSSIVGNFN